MPFTPSWYVEKRVLWLELSGVVTADDLQEGNATTTDLLRRASDGTYLVWDGRDLRGLDASPAHIARMASWMQPPTFAGMILFSSPDSIHLEVTGEIVARMRRIPAESASTLREIHQRLEEFDPSLADLLPDLNA